jgi:hypothetical protein
LPLPSVSIRQILPYQQMCQFYIYLQVFRTQISSSERFNSAAGNISWWYNRNDNFRRYYLPMAIEKTSEVWTVLHEALSNPSYTTPSCCSVHCCQG